SEDLRDAVQTVIHLTEQSPTWPLYLKKPDLALFALGEPWQERLPVNPFPNEYAEDDRELLFSRETLAFWEEHPLYQKVTRTDKTEIITGESGTGKTAMALALGEYLHDKDTLACYLPGLPEERDIQYALAQKMLTFICWHPTLLRRLGQDSRVLLVRVCANALGAPYVLAALDSVSVEDLSYVKEGQDREREIRSDIVRSQLRLFRDTVASLPTNHYDTFEVWSKALAHCAQALGFKLPIRVVIDASGEHLAEWINDILSRVSSWKMNGMIAKIFVSSNIENTVRFPINHSGWLVVSKLEWDAALLSQMLDHRFENIMTVQECRIKRPEIASDELWAQMIVQAKVNPRCFVRLWNRMLSLATIGILDETI
ncbi:MAG: ATP-binding protein, partial [Anaerolineae bacterium]|nr:ATP-binding protein [Anaerolineae bacterium]